MNLGTTESTIEGTAHAATPPQKRTFMELCRMLFAPIAQIKRVYIRGVVNNLLAQLGDISAIIVFKVVGDRIQEGNTDGIIPLLSIYGACLIVLFVINFFIRYRGPAELWPRLLDVIHNDAIKRFFVLSPSHVESIGTGRIAHIIDNGVDNWINTMRDIQYISVSFVVKVAFALWIIGQVSIWYSICFLGILIIGQLIIMWLNGFAMKRRNKRKEEQVAHARLLMLHIMAKREILLGGNIQYEQDRVSAINKRFAHYNYKVTDYVFFMFSIPLFLIQGGLLAALITLIVTSTITGGPFPVGTFAALVATSGYLIPLMINVTEISKDISKNFVHIDKLRDLLENTPRIHGYNTGRTFAYSTGQIVISDLSYAYPSTSGPTQSVFDNFDLTIAGGKKTALVGASGSGKSTLLKLISGYLRPTSGSISIDKQNLHDVSLVSYYRHVGYLTQEPSIFDGTIRENLVYAIGKKETTTNTIDDERLHDALAQAQCQFVYDLPDGRETEIGERGIRLSGGQRQRLAIAKIFVKNPEIILLDEPTAALDSISEEAITTAMHNLFAGRTVVIIAHRLQTVKHADDIIVLDNGAIIERGTHTQLINAHGSYAQMLELQSGF